MYFVEFLHVKPGKGAAFVRTKMRNYVTGNTVEKTFRAGVTVCFLIFCIGFVAVLLKLFLFIWGGVGALVFDTILLP